MKRIILSLLLVAPVFADDLERGFLNPPDSAKPHTWCHWMNGNVTKEGITADLEALTDAVLNRGSKVSASTA